MPSPCRPRELVSAQVWHAMDGADRGLSGRTKGDSGCVEGAGTCPGHLSPPAPAVCSWWAPSPCQPYSLLLPLRLDPKQDCSLPGHAGAFACLWVFACRDLSPWNAGSPHLSPGTCQSPSETQCWSCWYQFVLASCASSRCLPASSAGLHIFIKWRQAGVLAIVACIFCFSHRSRLSRWAPGLAPYKRMNCRLENYSENTPAVGIQGAVKHLVPLLSRTPPGGLSIPGSAAVPPCRVAGECALFLHLTSCCLLWCRFLTWLLWYEKPFGYYRRSSSYD